MRLTAKPVLWTCLFTFCTLLVFLPAFLTEFGLHNDYSMLSCHFSERQAFPESQHLFLVGRPLQAVLLTWLGWAIQETADFAFVRFASYLFLLLFAGLFGWFLARRYAIGRFWGLIIALGVMLVPPAQVYVLWVTHFFPGSFTLFLAMTAYLCLDSVLGMPAGNGFGGRPFRRMFLLTTALAFFLAALLIYPPNALFVFVCTLAAMLFSSLKDWPRTRKLIFRDILFFGIGMALYLVINILIIIPRQPFADTPYSIAGTRYEFGLSADLWSKIPLVGETFLTALDGIWHPAWGMAGRVINVMILTVTGGILFVLSRSQEADKRPDRDYWKRLASAVTLGALLFLLANSPALLAKGCRHLIGYRVVFSGMVMVWLLPLAGLYKCERLLKRSKGIFCLRGLAVALVCGAAGMAFMNVRDASRNFNRELCYIRDKVASADFDKVSQVMIVLLPWDQGETLIGRRMPYEFSYAISVETLAQPVVDRAARAKAPRELIVRVDDGDIIFYDRHTEVIDLNQAREEPGRKDDSRSAKPRAYVTTSADASRRIEVSRQRGGVFFTFHELLGRHRMPFWQTDFNPGTGPWIQFDFQDDPRAVQVFTFGVFGRDSRGAEPVGCRLQVSDEGRRWKDVDTAIILRDSRDRNFKAYRVEDPARHTRYRFYFVPEGGLRSLAIRSVHMMVKLKE